MNFVGFPGHSEAYDLEAQRERIAVLRNRVRDLLDARDWSLGNLPADCLKVNLDASASSLDWEIELAIERARERVLDAHQASYLWEQSPGANAIRRDLADLDRDIRRLRQVIGEVSVEAADACLASLVPGLAPTWYPSLEGTTSCSYSFHIKASAGKLVCPSCKEASFDNDRLLNRWGVPSCQSCNAIFADAQNHDLRIPDGVSRLLPGVVADQAVRETLYEARQDDGRFNQYGPFDDWKAGTLRLHVAVLGGRIVGFATWNNLSNGTVTLRIVWVNRGFRRRGLGRRLLDAEAASLAKFAVESPSEDFYALIESTGYLQTKDVRQVNGG